jgi:hypothetical protein
MKRKTLFLAVLLAVTSLNANAWDDVLTARRLAISSVGGQKQFYVKSKVKWTLTTPNNWISIKPASGNGSTEWGDRDGGELITVTVWPSDSISPETGDAVVRRERTGFITLNYGTTEVNLPVYQLNHDSCYHNGEAILVKPHGEIPAGQKPIPIMLFGDGWDLMDLYKSYHEDDGRGFFAAYAKAWADRCSSIDVMKEFADYFDIYCYSGESMQRGTHGLSRYRPDPHASRNMDMAVSDANLTIKNHINYDNAIFVDFSNDTPGGWNFSAGGRQYAAYGNPDNDQTGLGWWGHEFTGHDVSNMPDFYSPTRSLCWKPGYYPGQNDATCTEMTTYSLPEDLNASPLTQFTKFPDAPHFRSGEFPTYYKHDAGETAMHAPFRLYGEWDAGYYWNVDYEKDPEKVIWKDFIGRTGYNHIKVNDGQTYTGTAYYYRPEPINEMIRENAGWDLGLRIWIWNRLLERAGVGNPHNLSAPNPEHPRSIENFMEWDKAGGYANNKTGWKNNPAVPQLLTKAYFHAHNLHLLAPFTYEPQPEHYNQATPPKYPEGFINLTLVSTGDQGTGWECKTAPNYNKGTHTDVIVINQPGEYKFVGSTSINNIQVEENIKDVTIELRNAYIDVASQTKSAIDIRGGAETTIKLYGDNYLGGGPNAAGISVPCKGGSSNVPATASVTITSSAGDGSTDGFAKITSGTFAAGIGGGNLVHTSNGKITINGGTLEIYGSGERPGIGGRAISGTVPNPLAEHSLVTINGGKITAIAGTGSAGIGAGTQKNDFGAINITGGAVYTSGNGNAALGGGGKGTINITGGTIVARNTVNADGTPTKPGIGGATEITVANAGIIATGIDSKITVTNASIITSNLTGNFTDGGNALIIKDDAISLAQHTLKTGATEESTISTNLLLTGNTTIPSGTTLIIPEGENLVVNNSITLAIEGQINLLGGLTCNNGNIEGKDKITISGNGYFSDCGQVDIPAITTQPTGATIRPIPGGITIQLPEPGKIDIYTLTGQKQYSLQYLTSPLAIPLNKGLYIIRAGGKGYKIQIN